MIKICLRLLTLILLTSLTSCSLDSSSPPPNSPLEPLRNSEATMVKPTVIMISIDGFRFDYLEKFQPPHLLKIAQAGVRAEGLRPSFPSLTFPNHITLVTGLTPGRHGIVSNVFYDEKTKEKYNPFSKPTTINKSSWYEADAIWTIAAKNQMLSAVYFWVGSEANIGGKDPTYFIPYSDEPSSLDRVNQVIEWLELPKEVRPHYLGLYFSDVDSKGHKFGPNSEEVRSSLLEIDSAIGVLNNYVESKNLPVNFVIVSDHGMLDLDPTKTISVADMTSTSGFQIADRGPSFMLYSDDEEKISKAYSDIKAKEDGTFKVYLRKDVPAELKYKHSTKVGDIVLIAEPPYYITDKNFSSGPATSSKATHGWKPTEPMMKGLFIAKGPQIKKGIKIPAFDNVHVAPFVLNLLKLPIPKDLDGSPEHLSPILAP